jgi:hypothetical protein
MFRIGIPPEWILARSASVMLQTKHCPNLALGLDFGGQIDAPQIVRTLQMVDNTTIGVIYEQTTNLHQRVQD